MPTYDPAITTGGSARVTIGGSPVYCRNVKIAKKFTTDDITTTGDNDATSGLTYTRKLVAAVTDTITFDGFIDANNDTLATLAGAAHPGEIDNVVITIGGKVRTYPKIILMSVDLDSKGVMNANVYAVTAESQGPYTES